MPVYALAQVLHDGVNCANPDQMKPGEADGNAEQVASQLGFEVGKLRLGGQGINLTFNVADAFLYSGHIMSPCSHCNLAVANPSRTRIA